MIDPLKVMRAAFVAAGTGYPDAGTLYARTGARWFAPKLPPKSSFPNTSPGGWFRVVSGSRETYGDHVECTFEVWCYGGTDASGRRTELNARTTYGLVHDRFHAMMMQDVYSGETLLGRILHMEDESAGEDLIDEETEWPFVRTFLHCSMMLLS